jgi:uncharacterized protein YfiM (DUF2279 family)
MTHIASNRLLGRDKVLHFVFSFAVTLTVYFGTGALGYAAIIAGAIGLAKEVRDDTHGGSWSWLDLAADAAGILLAIPIALLQGRR